MTSQYDAIRGCIRIIRDIPAYRRQPPGLITVALRCYNITIRVLPKQPWPGVGDLRRQRQDDLRHQRKPFRVVGRTGAA